MILGAFGSSQVLAEGSPDEVFTQVSDIFKNLPKLKSTSLHGYDVTFITGEARKGVLFVNFLRIRAYVVPAAKRIEVPERYTYRHGQDYIRLGLEKAEK